MHINRIKVLAYKGMRIIQVVCGSVKVTVERQQCIPALKDYINLMISIRE